jgi:hypothetical protein
VTCNLSSSRSVMSFVPPSRPIWLVTEVADVASGE